MSESRSEIVLSLISHTNIGKTTLSRTLLKRDVGEIRDSAHVTIESQSHELLRNGKDALILWDTPGFGNVSKLTKRVKAEGGALGWLMHEVVDRMVNKSLYSSLEATRNVQNHSDVVLYLVNVQEKPDEAGYVEQELILLDALKKPTIILLNQLSDDTLHGETVQELESIWSDYSKAYSCVKNVITLDAFTRTWEQEVRLIDEVSPWLPSDKQDTLSRLRKIFIEDQEKNIEKCIYQGSDLVYFAILQKVPYRNDLKEKQAMAILMSELQRKIDEYIDFLTELHKIESSGQAELEKDLLSLSGMIEKVSEKKSGLFAGALASAGSGLIADILAGGLTLGGGALVGFIGGYVGGVSYAKLINFREKQDPSWEVGTLEQIIKLVITHYLIVALHGRGKGRLHLKEPATVIVKSIDKIWNEHRSTARQCIQLIQKSKDNRGEFSYNFADLFRKITQTVCEQIFGK